MNKPVYLGLSILKLRKILMYEFWCDYAKPKYGEKAKLCYYDTNSFIVYIKTQMIFIKTLQKMLKTRFDTWNYELDRPLPKGKSKKSNYINAISIRWKNNDKISQIKSKNSKLLNR